LFAMGLVAFPRLCRSNAFYTIQHYQAHQFPCPLSSLGG
jgi:hypothetical protein